MTETAQKITKQFAEPFEPGEVKHKPQTIKGERALAVAYIDARCVMDRLDEVVGVGGWSDEYRILEGGSVECRLTVVIDGVPVTKVDVGSESEQSDGQDRLKAAYSDALKRAAVKFGIGRYLYSLPLQWLPYDPATRKFTQAPKLPATASKPAANTADAAVVSFASIVEQFIKAGPTGIKATLASLKSSCDALPEHHKDTLRALVKIIRSSGETPPAKGVEQSTELQPAKV